MSEWLTTGQMIDRLKVGEVAESKPMSWRGVIVNPKRVIKDNGVIRFEDSDEILSLNAQIMDSQWRILPKYVSFEEAIKAYKEGKDITYHHNTESKYTFKHRYFISFNNLCLDSIGFHELIEGKWTIED
jgi:hypothetical protein